MNRFIASAAAALAVAGAVLAGPVAGPAPQQTADAQVIGPNLATWADNAVENSAYSNTSILVTGLDINRQTSPYRDVIAPRYTSRSTGYYMPGSNGPIWNPEMFAVAPGADVLYRVINPRTGWTDAWKGAQGGANGTWVSAGNLFRFFDCTPGLDPCTVQVIQNRP